MQYAVYVRHNFSTYNINTGLEMESTVSTLPKMGLRPRNYFTKIDDLPLHQGVVTSLIFSCDGEHRKAGKIATRSSNGLVGNWSPRPLGLGPGTGTYNALSIEHHVLDSHGRTPFALRLAPVSPSRRVPHAILDTPFHEFLLTVRPPSCSVLRRSRLRRLTLDVSIAWIPPCSQHRPVPEY